MEYIRKENGKMVKYEVEFNWSELEVIKRKIIKNCGIREHISYDTDFLEINNCLLMENYTRKASETKDCYGEKKVVYHVEYDFIHEPFLAKLIDRKKIEIVEYLFWNKEIIDRDILDEYDRGKENLLTQLNELLLQKEKMDCAKAKMILDKIKELEEQDEINKKLNLEDQANYIDEMKKYVTINKVDELDVEIYDRVMNFSKVLKK